MKKAGILFCLAALLLGSCKSYRNAQAPVVENITHFKPKLADGGLDMTFTTRLRNPDKLSFRIKDADLDVMIAGVRLAKIENTKKVRIRGVEYPEVDWAVRGELKPLLAKPGVLIGNVLRGKVSFEVSGYITVKKLFMSRRVPVKLKLPVEIPVN